MKTKTVEETESVNAVDVVDVIDTVELQKLKVELTVEAWEVILSVIEKSTAPYIQVLSVTTELIKQLEPQIKKDDK
jgi:hypothetical protein